jgi:drug/metabolite transporter (DMT)-like permease
VIAAPLPPPIGSAIAGPAGGAGRAIAWMLCGTLLFAGMNASAKALGTGYSAIQLIFFRNLFALVPVGVALVLAGDTLASLKTKRLIGHMMRAIAGLVSLGGFFYAYPRLPLATTVAVSFAAPLFVAALSWPMLGERVGPRRVVAILIGFCGVLVIVHPTAAGLDPSVAVVIVATFLYALIMIFMRHLNRTETPTSIVFYYLVASVAFSGLAMPFVWVPPDFKGWLLLVALGFFGGCGQIAMTTAFRHGNAAVVAPFDYASILWSSGLGWLIWNEWPGPRLWLGVAILVSSGLYIAHRETRMRRAAA